MSASPAPDAPSLPALFSERGGVGGAFSTKAADYAAARPRYPAALFERLRANRTLYPAAQVADIAAGTGLFTGQLLYRGYNVTAVEPNAAMLAVAVATLAKYRKYRSIAASAEATTLADAAVDVITAAQAFHWFDVEAVRREWLRVLKPDGRVVLVWNTRPLSDPLHKALDDLLGEFGGDKQAVLDRRQDLSYVPAFFAAESFERLEFANMQQLDHDGLISLALSRSAMPDRDTPQGERAVQKLSRLFARHARDGQVSVSYRTVAFVGRPNAG
ncbi:MAG: class I SAM-dependent methyltransferase [Rudaea sp.]|uniref:class I SAM-dependent methyltransferase n=1 Tax=Rudaea sp. TaxID=2136325 RepID=UPI0039E612B8